MRKIFRAIENISSIGGYASGALVLLLMTLVMYEVFMRYVIGRAPGWANEISGYLLVGMSFLGLAYTWKEKGHIRVEALVSRLPVGFSQWLRLATLILALAFVILTAKESYSFLQDIHARQIYSVTQLRIFLLWPVIPLAIGFSFLSLQLIVEITKAVKVIRSRREKAT